MGEKAPKAPIKFAALWADYPSEHVCVTSAGKTPAGYDNQCAIKLGWTLEKAGVSFASFHGARCPVGPKTGGMVANAQALANW